MHPSGTVNKDESMTVLQSIIDDQVRETAVVMAHELHQLPDPETDPGHARYTDSQLITTH